MVANPTGQTLLIAAGGTGGHISPGTSIAAQWLKKGRVLFATLGKNADYPDIVSLARHPKLTLVTHDAPRAPRNPLQLPRFLWQFVRAYQKVHQSCQRENLVAVVGMGGYSSLPAVLWAICNRRPLYLCEQNARWGLVTRLARPFARRVFLAFPDKTKRGPKYTLTGNPLRAGFSEICVQRKKPRDKTTLLFLGGSQGAKDINDLYLAFIATPQAKDYHCIVSAGPQHYAELKKSARHGDEVYAFITEMPKVLANADVVVARCGSSTLSELLWAQKPAFLIPYPFAAADHQRANAEAVAPFLHAVVFDQRPFSAAPAVGALREFLHSLPPKTPPQQFPADPAVAAQRIVRYIEEDLSAIPQ